MLITIAILSATMLFMPMVQGAVLVVAGYGHGVARAASVVGHAVPRVWRGFALLGVAFP